MSTEAEMHSPAAAAPAPLVASRPHARPPVGIENDLAPLELHHQHMEGLGAAATSGVIAGGVTAAVHFATKPIAWTWGKITGKAVVNTGEKIIASNAPKLALGAAKFGSKEGAMLLFGSIPGVNIAMAAVGIGMNTWGLVGQWSDIKKVAEHTGKDGGLFTIITTPELRQDVVRTVRNYLTSTAVDCVVAVPGVGGIASFFLSMVVQGQQIYTDVSDPTLTAKVRDLQETLDKGGALSLKQVGEALVKNLEVSTDPENHKLAKELTDLIAKKDPAVTELLNGTAQSMRANRNAAGSLDFAVRNGKEIPGVLKDINTALTVQRSKGRTTVNTTVAGLPGDAKLAALKAAATISSNGKTATKIQNADGVPVVNPSNGPGGEGKTSWVQYVTQQRGGAPARAPVASSTVNVTGGTPPSYVDLVAQQEQRRLAGFNDHSVS